MDLFITAVEINTRRCQIWAQTDFEKYGQIEALLQDDANRLSHGDLDAGSLHVGCIYVVRYHDENWYRAQLLGLEVNESEVNVAPKVLKLKVLFVDFGNIESVGVQDVSRGIPACFEYPPLASKFILADIEPADEKKWTDEEAKYLSDSLLNFEAYGEVLHSGTVGCFPPTVRVFDARDSNEPYVTRFISGGVGKVSNNPETRYCSVVPNPLRKEQMSHVYITHSISPVNFWIQQADATEELDELHSDIEKFVNNESGSSSVHLGMLCAAKYSETDSYYRSVVTECHEEQSCCEVTFIDYGNSETVSKDNVISLPANFGSIAAKAVPCTLNWDAIQATNFPEVVECDTLHAKTIGVLDSGVHVVILSTGEGDSAKEEMDAMLAASYTPVQFDMGSLQDVCISHVEDSGYFFCQLLSGAKCLETCMEQILHSVSVHPCRLSQTSIKPGTPCLAKNLVDGIVYRSQIVLVSQEGVEVKFVDFGTVETVEPEVLFCISAEQMSLPTQAIYCSLSDTDDLPPSQIVDLLKQYESSVGLVAKVVLRAGQLCDMVMFDTRNGQDVSLTVLAKTGATVNGNVVRPAEVAVGSTEKLYVTAVISGVEFFGQLAKYSAEKLEAFQSRLNKHYSLPSRAVLERVIPGQVCCTLFPRDSAFYRATVLQRTDSQSDVQVAFMDYGNQERKACHELLALDPEFCALPQQGISCLLSDFYSGLSKEQLETWLLEQEVVVQLCQTKAHSFSVTFPDDPANAHFLTEIKW